MRLSAQTAALATGNPRRSALEGADLLLLVAAIALASLPLWRGHSIEPLVFLPGRVAAGEWWRLFTHPFAHVSLYHLALDAGAFLLLYHGLRARAPRRLLYAAGSAAGSLLAASFTAGFADHGLCGLSGAAHGLMAVTALELAESPASRSVGLAALLLVAAKSLLEAATGTVVFADLHLGFIGAPVAACHLGGVAGGASAWAVLRVASVHFGGFLPGVAVLTAPSGEPRG